MSSSSVYTVKCVDCVPGSRRYCSSVIYPVTQESIGSGILATVVQPYESGGVVESRIVDVSCVSLSVTAQLGAGDTLHAVVAIGVFDTVGNEVTLCGKYVVPFDEGRIDIGDCGGAVVVGQGNVFGVKLEVVGSSSAFTGRVGVNFEFGLVGHSL